MLSLRLISIFMLVFEYPILGSTLVTQSSLYGLFINNTRSYAEKVAEYPLEIFDYRQAIANMNVSYIAIRDDSQITRFAKDPLFSLVFINKEVAIFQIHTFDPLDLDGNK